MDSITRSSDSMRYLVGNVIFTIPTDEILREMTPWILEGNHREVHNIVINYFEIHKDGLFSPVTLDRFMIDLSRHIENLASTSEKSSTLVGKVKDKILTLLNNLRGTRSRSSTILSNSILKNTLVKLMAKYCYYGSFDQMVSGAVFLKEWKLFYGMNQNP